jgi:hypothetical protein
LPKNLPRRSDVELWNTLIWEDCWKLTVGQLAQFVEHQSTIDNLAKLIKGKTVHAWMGDFYELLALDEAHVDAILSKHKLFPNQKGVLCKKSALCKDAGDIPEEFKDILELLGRKLRDELLLSQADANVELAETRDRAYAIRTITSEVQEKTNDRETANLFRAGFRRLLLWFRANPGQAPVLFPALYRQKHLLYDDEEIMDNMEKAEQLTALLTEFKVADVTQLRSVLASRTTLLPITQEIIVNMGISSVEEWAEAIKDKDLAALFTHESTPSADMFVYAQSLISKAKQNIISHLRTLPQYDLAHAEETATTVLAGILKDGQSVTIVVRPAYNKQVIIYYGSERDVLDYEYSELWIDDGTKPRRITLGHILKTADIRKFPI